MNSTIQTYTGRFVDPLHLNPNEIDIQDIAQALSNMCRFAGHVSKFYSVAQHSVECAQIVDKMTGGDRVKTLWALLHDASEAYLVDLPRPVKHSAIGDRYREVERYAMEQICWRFHLPFDEPEEIRFADDTMLSTEQRDLMPDGAIPWNGIKARDRKVIPLTPFIAKLHFLKLYNELTKDAIL